MVYLKHQSADETHYDKQAESYNAINDDNALTVNQTIESLLCPTDLEHLEVFASQL